MIDTPDDGNYYDTPDEVCPSCLVTCPNMQVCGDCGEDICDNCLLEEGDRILCKDCYEK